jgi:hypothetical protein
MYVLVILNLALLLAPYSNLLHVISMMCMVKYVSAYVIKLTRKLPNNLTYRMKDHGSLVI